MCRFSLLREQIIHSFTNDEEIHAAMSDCWWLLVGTAAMAPIVGIFEGLGTARHYFKTLFFVILVAVGAVYLPIIIYNSFTYRVRLRHCVSCVCDALSLTYASFLDFIFYLDCDHWIGVYARPAHYPNDPLGNAQRLG